MRISIIVAKDQKNAIGKNNSLPWHLRDDLQMFKRVTMGHSILMGRKTYESIGHALPGRQNIVLSRQQDLSYPDAQVFQSFDDVLDYCVKNATAQLFIIGGAQLFSEFLEKADLLYITDVDTVVEGADVFLPEINYSLYDKIYYSNHAQDDQNDHAFVFNLYIKK